VPHENLFALPTEKGTRVRPGANGGPEWSPISVNPQLGYAGKLLWQFNGGAGCTGTPMSVELDGDQCITQACGRNFQLSYPLGDAILVFGLPKVRAGR
jgi:glucose dehydrogenase